MIKINNKKALTLTELLVATILIGIVMVGVVSFSEAIRQFQETSRGSSVLSAQLETAMAYMVQDGMKTIGDATNCGVLWSDGMAGGSAICFRHDASPPTPENYGDDSWVCYSSGEPDNGKYPLYRCPAGTSPGNNFCPDLAQRITLLSIPAIKVMTDPPTYTEPDWFIVDTFSGTTDNCDIKHIHFNLTTRSNAARAENPINNPEYSLQSTISPPAQSR